MNESVFHPYLILCSYSKCNSKKMCRCDLESAYC